jgi:peptide/nickel transport system permease protein
MTQYIIRRFLSMIPVLIGVSILVFSFVHLIPGDPAVALLGERASTENVAYIRQRMGLDKPLYEQYFIYMKRTLSGDLGDSIHGNIPISAELKNRFPATVELSIMAMILAVLIGIPAGIFSAIYRNSIIDTLTMFGALLGVSMPVFWLGLLLMWFFALILGWFPTGSRLSIGVELQKITHLYLLDSLLAGNMAAFFDALKHIALPAVALGSIPGSIIARMTRSAMLDVLGQDYVRTARAKGLAERVVVVRHALRNALMPVITVIGLQVGGLLSGAILTETIFSWPGIGKWVFDSISGRDYPIVQSMTLIITLIFVFINLLVDVSYAMLNPRIRYQ